MGLLFSFFSLPLVAGEMDLETEEAQELQEAELWTIMF
nr:MAG TPA: hypothetical protein [Bacteriophage sp.]